MDKNVVFIICATVLSFVLFAATMAIKGYYEVQVAKVECSKANNR